MKKDKKDKVLRSISNNLLLFNKDYKNKFLCPVCLSIIDLGELNKITEAHIIPKVTGNNLITWLCSECNSKFVHLQDRWFGEYINIKKSKTIFSDKTTTKGIYIDGTKVYGKIRHDNNTIDILINTNRNSKENIKSIEPGNKGSFNVEIDIPVLSKKNEIKVGFINAADLTFVMQIAYAIYTPTLRDSQTAQFCVIWRYCVAIS